jgi:hypothetical protein
VSYAHPAHSEPRIGLVKVRGGDDPAWSAPAFDDSGWQEMHWSAIDPQQRLLWVRVHVSLPAIDLAAGPTNLNVSALASYEAYWNGARIAHNGMPAADKQHETPGLIDTQFQIPPQLLRPGDNVLALRMSSFHARRMLAMPMQYLALERGRDVHLFLVLSRLPVVAASGALLLGMLYFGAMYVSDRRDRGSALLSLLSLSVLGQLGAEMARLFGFEYPWQILRLEAILGFAALSGILLVLYVLQRFARLRRGPVITILLGVMIPGIALTPGFDGKTAVATLVPMLFALVAAGTGVAARVPGARGVGVAIVLVLGSFALAPARFLDETYYLAATAFLLFLFAQQVMALRRAQTGREAAQLHSVRLELELLKRQIHPHFLMNTLTALSELIESDPKAGVAMIEALGDEMRALALASGESTISMAAELELCRAHLKVMGFRKEQAFTLVASNVNLEARVPPGVFHTLIENAFSHNDLSNGAEFVLEEAAGADGRRVYRLRSPLTVASAGTEDGQGHAYVRARLREAFGDRGRFAAHAAGLEWLAVIEMPRFP